LIEFAPPRQLKRSTTRTCESVRFLARKIGTIVLGVFAMPAVLAVAALVFLVLAIALCPSVRDRPTLDCQNCQSQWCPFLLAAVIFIALPLGLTSLYLYRRRKARHHDASD